MIGLLNGQSKYTDLFYEPMCSYCVLKRIKKKAKAKKQKVELKFQHGGISVYVNGKRQAWFFELTDKCCCD